MVRWQAGIAAMAMSLAACGGGASGDTTLGPQGQVAVTGSLRNTWLRDDGTTEPAVPSDLAQYAVSAFVQEGGAWEELAGTFNADGGYAIPGVGSGSYLLRVLLPSSTPRYLVDPPRNVDLGADYLGLPNRTYAVRSTPVTFAVSGLEPWAIGNSLTLFTTDSRLALPLHAASSSAGPSVGVTSAALPIDFRGRPLPASGSAAWVFQTVQRTAGTIGYSVVTRAAEITGVPLPTDGAAATVPVALTSPSLEPVGLDLHRSEFLAGLAGVAPAATVTATTFTLSVRAVPRASTYLTSAHYPVLFFATLPADATDFDFGPIGYAGTFPASFTVVRLAALLIQVQVPAALGQPAATVVHTASRVEPVAGAPATIVPALGPARLPLVAGRSGLQPQSGVGLTPTLSWSAPALGTPSYYIVQINEISGGAALLRGSVYVHGTSFTVPPLLLQAGKVYVANVISVAEPGFDFSAPYRYTVPRELVPFFTAPFTP